MVAASLGLFLLGSLAGSWIDHATLAIPARRRPFGLPACAHCERPVRGLALAPLLGPFIAPRCPDCNEPGSRLRPLTEVVSGFLFVLTYWRFGSTPHTVATLLFIVLLLLLLRIDWTNHLIFPTTIYAGLLLAIGYAAIFPRQPNALLWAVVGAAGAAFFFLLLYLLARLLYRRRALGFGDVLLAALIGAMAGTATVRALLLGMLLAAAGGLLLVALRVRTMRDYIPYGAYLCAGTIAVLLFS